jgi:hypothetical protein
MLLEKRILPGLAADNSSAVHYRDGTLVQAVCSRLGAQVYRVYPDGGQAVEEKLAMTFLSPAPCD